MKKAAHFCLFFTICSLFFLISSCRPTVDLLKTNEKGTYQTDTSYSAIFKALWQGIDRNYVYWDVEDKVYGQGSYWDNVWNTYKPKFAALGHYPDNWTKAQSYFDEIFTPLHDSHFVLSAYNEAGDNLYYISPQEKRVDARYSSGKANDNPVVLSFTLSKEYPDAWDYWATIKTTIGSYLTGSPALWEDTDKTGFYALAGKITSAKIPRLKAGDYVLYLFFTGFDFNKTISTEIKNGADSKNPPMYLWIRDNFLKPLIDSKCKGVIFDVRGNSGGSTSEITMLLSSALPSDMTIGYQRMKNGEGRGDFLPWEPDVVRTAVDPTNRTPGAGTMPVVALIDDYSISCAEILALAVKTMPNGYLIGTKTFGATGVRIDGSDSVYPNSLATNSGSFSVETLTANSADFLHLLVIEAGVEFRGLNGTNYEGVGIEPDKTVSFSQSAFAGGTDDQLQTALDYINAKLP
jgi:hypothetical protein